MINANVAPTVLTASLQMLLLNINGGIHLISEWDDICVVGLVCTSLPLCENRQGHIDLK